MEIANVFRPIALEGGDEITSLSEWLHSPWLRPSVATVPGEGPWWTEVTQVCQCLALPESV